MHLLRCVLEENFTGLMIAVGILLMPVVLALPLRFWWAHRVGNEPEHAKYRSFVRRVLDSGEPISSYRLALDHEAKRAGIHPFCITIDQQAREYLPHMYGAVNYTLIDDVRQLPIRVSSVYRQLTV